MPSRSHRKPLLRKERSRGGSQESWLGDVRYVGADWSLRYWTAYDARASAEDEKL